MLKTGYVWPSDRPGWTREETQAAAKHYNHTAQLKISFSMKRNGQIMWEDWQKMSARIGSAVSSERKTCFGETKTQMARARASEG